VPLARLVSAARAAPETPLFSARASQTVAAVDLGSNSFHMIVARVLNGQLHVLDRLQEMVRLAAGLDDQNRLDKESRERALDCLSRFGERLRDMPANAVRVVGTNTLRRARNAAKFLTVAERALGHRIEIISGQEEARLIYQGVAHYLPDDERQRLVLDIGGGSTEIVVGRRLEPVRMESLYVGCVSLSREHFPKGRITPKAMRQAETAAHLEFQPVEAQFRALGWQAAYGSSGTVRAIGAALTARRDAENGITLDGLYRLREALLAAGHVRELKSLGIGEERAAVLPGGLAVLIAAFEALKIERLAVSDGALREGLLYDLFGRIRHEDVRAGTIASLTARYHVDRAQAARVARTAREAFAQVAEAWDLGEEEQALEWAARLHEIGLAIAHSKYHRHGAYLVQHSDLPGFSWQEQRLLAVLIRAHRRRFPEEVFDELPRKAARTARRLAMLLRLAVVLHRGRVEQELPAFTIQAGKRSLKLKFPRGWFTHHPLTHEDLAQEAAFLDAAGLRLKYS
jgi:exopolyphosphatase/guanosine-5'-triphosphate,3'-diphosphate pyrophosphatase